MIIYPGNHKIEADSEETTQSTLQLGYFREVDHNVNPRVKLEDDFCAPSKTLLYPYQQFKNKDILFRDKQGNTIESGDILRYSDGFYYFLPQDSVEYGPASFSADASWLFHRCFLRSGFPFLFGMYHRCKGSRASDSQKYSKARSACSQ